MPPIDSTITVQSDTLKQGGTTIGKVKFFVPDTASVVHSPCDKIDTTHRVGKAERIWCELKDNIEYSEGCKQLLDVNGDGWSDLFIEYYGLSGTGLKNRIQVYLYHPEEKQFLPCDQLNSLYNPTFYFNRKEVFGWYVALGGGDACRLKWQKNGFALDTISYTEISVSDGSDELFEFKETNYRTGKITQRKSRHIPGSYNYKPLIKRPCNH